MSDCADAVKRLDLGDLVEWAGLPYPCAHADLSEVLEGGDEAGNGMLSGQRMQFRMYRAPHQPELVQAWFNDRLEVVLMTLVQPRLAVAAAELLERLGPPDKKLGPEIGYHADAHQWIYAQRGMTLYVREHLQEVARVALYQPSVPEYYETYLGARDQRHYWPVA